MPILSILQKDGTTRVVKMSDKIFYSKSTGAKLSGEQLRKRINISAEAFGGSYYKSHSFNING